jgi:hypothetical protein
MWQIVWLVCIIALSGNFVRGRLRARRIQKSDTLAARTQELAAFEQRLAVLIKQIDSQGMDFDDSIRQEIDAIGESDLYRNCSSEIWSRYCSATQKYYRRIEYRQIISQLHQRWLDAIDAPDGLNTLDEMAACLDCLDWFERIGLDSEQEAVRVFGGTIESIRRLFNERVTSCFDALAAIVPLTCEAFLDMYYIQSNKAIHKQRGHDVRFECPGGWNDCVVRYFENPDWRIFARIKHPGELEPGELRLMACTAIKARDLVGVMIALAYVNSDWDRCRKAVGAKLAADLGYSAVALRSRLLLDEQDLGSI